MVARTKNCAEMTAGYQCQRVHQVPTWATDRNLLWDAARVMVRTADELADEWKLPGWRQARHHTLTLRRLYQRVASTRRSEAWRENVDVFGPKRT